MPAVYCPEVVEAEQILRDFGLIVGAGLISQAIATLLRLPEMVVLVAVGALIGPSVLGLAENPLEGVGAQLVFTIGVSLILFHGGTGISLRVISRTAVGLGLLVLPGVFLTAVIVALAVATVFGVPLSVALMVGAVLAATDPAILIPLFDDIRLRPKVAQTVIAESGFNDPVGTVFALAVAGAVVSGEVALSGPAFEFVRSLLLGTLIGVVAGVALSYLVSTRKGGAWRESPAVAILAVVALGYFSVETLGGSGYLAAFVMGLIVGNMEFLHLGQHDEHADLLEGFASQVAEIAVLLVFITLGMNLPFAALNEYLVGGLVVMAIFIFVARPLTVLACLLPDRRGRWTREEIVFLSWCRETGVIPAALAALLLAQDVPGADIAVSMVALAICVTLLLQATTAGTLARRLGLAEE
ncbi:MAG: sodium:proton antiporter [Rubrobacter sp.]|nr:sodium:proton antiporter [Rubrobacter sp.]